MRLDILSAYIHQANRNTNSTKKHLTTLMQTLETLHRLPPSLYYILKQISDQVIDIIDWLNTENKMIVDMNPIMQLTIIENCISQMQDQNHSGNLIKSTAAMFERWEYRAHGQTAELHERYVRLMREARIKSESQPNSTPRKEAEKKKAERQAAYQEAATAVRRHRR